MQFNLVKAALRTNTIHACFGFRITHNHTHFGHFRHTRSMHALVLGSHTIIFTYSTLRCWLSSTALSWRVCSPIAGHSHVPHMYLYPWPLVLWYKKAVFWQIVWKTWSSVRDSVRTLLCIFCLFLVMVSFFPAKRRLFSTLDRKLITACFLSADSFLRPLNLIFSQAYSLPFFLFIISFSHLC